MKFFQYEWLMLLRFTFNSDLKVYIDLSLLQEKSLPISRLFAQLVQMHVDNVFPDEHPSTFVRLSLQQKNQAETLSLPV